MSGLTSSVRKRKNLTHFSKLTAVLILFSSVVFAQSQGRTRTYYIAADEVDWDYAPGGIDKMMGMKFDGYSKTFVEKGPHRIGTVYRKALYHEYTDQTFTHLKPKPPEWASSITCWRSRWSGKRMLPRPRRRTSALRL